MLAQTIEHPVLIDPDLYRRGFKDGTKSRMSGDHPDYLKGWSEGFKQYRCSVPAVSEGYLERGHGDELLNPV